MDFMFYYILISLCITLMLIIVGSTNYEIAKLEKLKEKEKRTEKNKIHQNIGDDIS